MRGAFGGTANPILIHTGPKKETRYGSVSIEQGKAYVEFYALWDSSFELVPDNCPAAQFEAAREAIESYFEFGRGFYDGDPIGASVKGCIEVDGFDDVMKQIDHLEEELISQERAHTEEFHRWLDDWFESIE